MNLRLAVPLVVLLLPLSGTAQIQLPSVFGHHMVLQQGQPIRVFGHARPGERLVVWLDGGPERGTVVDASGRFRVELPPEAAALSARALHVRGEVEEITLRDVAVGEVWLCSGQSNMEWPVSASANAAVEMAAADHPWIRRLKAPHALANAPQPDLEAAWEVCTPASAGSFSAVAYYFARALQAELSVPVGLLDVNWGGSRIEPWIAPEELARHPRTAASMQTLREAIEHVRTLSAEDREERLAAWNEQVQKSSQEYWERATREDPGTAEGWNQPSHDDSGWASMELPGRWDDVKESGLDAHDGLVWFRRRVKLPPRWVQRDLVLHLGTIDDADITYFNGTPVGATIQDWQARRSYPVPAASVTGDEVVVAVMVLDTGGAGGMTGPAAVMRLACGEETIDLTGSWRYRRGGAARGAGPWPQFADPLEEPGETFSSPAAMYCAMVHPLVPFSLRGALWYQGESNASEAEAYRDLLPLLIESWRSVFKQPDLAFGIVQLASFQALAPDLPAQGGWAELRDAQFATHRSVRGTGLAVTTDVGDAGDIHPRNKQEVGRRLALWALREVYQRPVGEWSGPLYRSARFVGGECLLEFDHVGEGLRCRDPGPLEGFAVAGADGAFVWAQAEIAGREVRVWSPEVAAPAAVRYGWCNNASRSNLINSAGLPASPFRTDGPPPGDR